MSMPSKRKKKGAVKSIDLSKNKSCTLFAIMCSLSNIKELFPNIKIKIKNK